MLVITSLMLALSMVFIRALPVAVGLVFFLAFGSLDGVFLVASLSKVAHGAWVPLATATLLTSLFLLWSVELCALLN